MVEISAVANIHRHYRITYARDRFDHILVDFHWGRIATRDQLKFVSFIDDADANRYVANDLERRASSKKWLGVGCQFLHT
jgi:predicted DNA-binding WGR domain protein